MKKLLPIMIALMLILPFASLSCAHARPPKPGPNFVWVDARTLPNGTVIHGHWNHVGTAHPGKVWVPRHKNANGVWVAGHWRNIHAPNKGAKWLPGHFGPKGRWIPGHWR